MYNVSVDIYKNVHNAATLPDERSRGGYKVKICISIAAFGLFDIE